MEELLTEKYTDAQIAEMPVLSLAHVGDGVYELLARLHALNGGDCRVAAMHQRTVGMVSAEAQARAAQKIKPLLNELEASYFRRGRNVKPHHAPPHKAGTDTYALATALETLFGELYLSGRTERLLELWRAAEEAFAEDE